MEKHALQELYGDLYTEKNVALSGIHTHSGPGGYLQYVLYIITSLGFVRESFDVLVTGIVEVSPDVMQLSKVHCSAATGWHCSLAACCTCQGAVLCSV